MSEKPAKQLILALQLIEKSPDCRYNPINGF
jgi:hypothetical protein